MDKHVFRGEQNSFMDKMYKVLKDSPMVILVWLVFTAMFVAGCMVFYEDTLSSKFGNDWIAATYNVTPFSSVWMGWVIALVPQIAQIAGTYILLAYSNDTSNAKGMVYVRMAQIMTPVFLLLDVGSDVFYRSNQLASPVSIGIGVVYSLTYYTIGSEIFVTLGFTFSTLLFFPALGQVGRVVSRFIGSFDNLMYSYKAESRILQGSRGKDDERERNINGKMREANDYLQTINDMDSGNTFGRGNNSGQPNRNNGKPNHRPVDPTNQPLPQITISGGRPMPSDNHKGSVR